MKTKKAAKKKTVSRKAVAKKIARKPAKALVRKTAKAPAHKTSKATAQKQIVHFVCEGNCMGLVTEEQYQKGAKSCRIIVCSHYGKPLKKMHYDHATRAHRPAR